MTAEQMELLLAAADEFDREAETLVRSHTKPEGTWDDADAFADWQGKRRLSTRLTTMAEVLAGQREESRRDVGSLSAWMDHLTHDIEAKDWEDENRYGWVETPAGLISLSVLTTDPCLEDCQLVAWTRAMVWHVIDRFEDQARVCFPTSTTMDEAEQAAASIERELTEEGA